MNEKQYQKIIRILIICVNWMFLPVSFLYSQISIDTVQMNVCQGSEWFILRDIVISETDKGDFAVVKNDNKDPVFRNMILELTGPFIFDHNANIPNPGLNKDSDLDVRILYDSQKKIRIRVRANKTKKEDKLTIKGIRLKPTNNASGAGSIIRRLGSDGGNAPINGSDGNTYAQFTVSTLPKPVTILLNNQPVNDLCKNVPIELTATKFNEAEYRWGFAIRPVDKLFSTGQDSVYRTPLNPGKYKVYTHINTELCEYFALNPLEVYELPKASFNANRFQRDFFVATDPKPLPDLGTITGSNTIVSDNDTECNDIRISQYCGSGVYFDTQASKFVFFAGANPDIGRYIPRNCFLRPGESEPIFRIIVRSQCTFCRDTLEFSIQAKGISGDLSFCPDGQKRELITVDLPKIGISPRKDTAFIWSTAFDADGCGRLIDHGSIKTPARRIGYNRFGTQAFYIVDLTEIPDLKNHFSFFQVYDSTEYSAQTCAQSKDRAFIQILPYDEQLELDVQGICEGAELSFVDSTDLRIYNNIVSGVFRYNLYLIRISDSISFPRERGHRFTKFNNPFETSYSEELIEKGIYEARLEVEDRRPNIEREVCFEPAIKTFAIQPILSPTPTVPYFEPFEQDDGGWISLARSERSSWRWDTLAPGVEIDHAGDGVAAWVTHPEGVFSSLEHSFLIGPCLDLKHLNSPMIAAQLFSQTPEEVDGLRMQLSNDNGETWTTLGKTEEGLPSGKNWYPTQNILALPADQNNLSQGWSGFYQDWQTTSHVLDEFKNQGTLAMRFEFASLQRNPIHEGFGVDSIWIGNRSRKVLGLYAANAPSLPDQQDWQGELNILYDFGERFKSDFLIGQFHTAFPNPDPINFLNTSLPSALALQHNMASTNELRIDGSLFPGNLQKLSPRDVLIRALDPAPFQIQNLSYSSLDSLAFELEPQFDLPIRELLVHVAIVDTALQTLAEWPFGNIQLRNVLVDMLPDAGGTYLHEAFTAGTPRSLAVQRTRPFPDFSFGNVGLLIWIEDFHTKEVLQAHFESTNIEILSLQERLGGPLATAGSGYLLYPNPFEDHVQIRYPEGEQGDLTLSLWNTQGQLLNRQRLEATLGIEKVYLGNLANGMYFVQIHDATRGLVHQQRLVKGEN